MRESEQDTVWDDVLNQMKDDEKGKERRKILKNIIIIGVGFFLNFTPYLGLAQLQSSLHLDDGLGVVAQAVLYGALIVSALLTPTVAIRILGHKWTIPLMFMGYVLWIVANGHGVWWTMVPASVIVGICGAPLWTAQASYYTLQARRYATLSGENEATVITRFFGIFFCFFQSSAVIGAIISSVILEPTTINGTKVTPSEEDLEFCGANDCPGNNVTNPNLDRQDSTLIWIMVGLYVGIAICGITLLMLFVDSLPKYLTEKNNKIKLSKEVIEYLLATLRQSYKTKQLLLLPITIYNGYEQGFFAAEFSKSYITCSVGIWNVGLVMIAFGVVNAVIAISTGYVVKYTGRKFLFISGFLLHLGVQIFMLIWMPHPDESYILYIVAGVWGASDAIWQGVLSALYGSLFSKESEAAFSSFILWQAMGFVIAFSISSVLCTSVKLYIQLGILVTGMTGYGVVEWIVYRELKCIGEDNLEVGKTVVVTEKF